MDVPPRLPQTFYVWPPHVTAGMQVRILRMLFSALQTRTGWPSPVPLTRWPCPEITFEEYNTWRVHGDQQRRPGHRRHPALTLADEARRQSKAETEARSRRLREIHEHMRIALVAIAVAGWYPLTLKNQEGIHIALDIQDGVRCQIDSKGFVVERVMEDRTVPALVATDLLTRDERDLVRRIATGAAPDHLNGLGHSGMGELLSIAANFYKSWIHLQDATIPSGGPNPSRADILRQRQAHALLLDEQTAKAARLFWAGAREREQEARTRQLHYEKMRPTQPPNCRRYA